MSDWNKHVVHRQEFRRLYEGGKNIYEIGRMFSASPETVRRGIQAVGGKTFWRARKYFRDGKRERQIKSTYGIVVLEMEKLWHLQKGMCLWCRAPLSKNVLDCVIDHIGGLETRGDKTKVRGLCCSSGHCNRLAGMVEAKEISSNSLFRPFVLRVKKIVRLHSCGGPLS